MGSNLNFKNFGMDPSPETGGGGCGRLPSNFPLARQHSIYSLTFDEFQSTVGGIGKDFGSMNMDELLKSIWSAEENQNIGQTSGVGNGVAGGSGGEGSDYLQRQGSLTLPRTLSQKKVDEVWRDMSKEYDASGSGFGNFSVPRRQPTLGEITLEDFLVRAGVVREEPPQIAAKPNNIGGIFGDLPNNLPLNVNGARSAAMQPVQPQQQPQLLPKQPALAYGARMGIQSGNQLSSPRIQGGIGISDQALNNNTMVQNVTTLQGGGLGIVGLGGNGVALGSPSVSSDGLSKSNGDMSSVSPVPFVFNGSLRGRKSAAVEKVVERRQRRMIKNRESAARSRARKQAYTTELEAEVAKLKEENEELRKKQAEMLDMQKNQKQEMMHQQNGPKRRCLRRTQTGPW